MVESHLLDNSEGNGSGSQIDDKYDSEEYTTKDQRAQTETTFYRSDINETVNGHHRRRQMKRALRYHEGEHVNAEDEDSRGQQNHKEWKRRLVGTLTSQMEMTKHQQSRVKHLVLDVLDINSFGPYKTEEVILGVMSMVAREDMSRHGKHLDDRKDFINLCHSVDTSLENVRRCRELVSERLD